MTTEVGTHFVANIRVEKVVKKQNQDRHSSDHGTVKRDVVETVNLTLKATTLDGLKAKIVNHTGLLDDEDL